MLPLSQAPVGGQSPVVGVGGGQRCALIHSAEMGPARPPAHPAGFCLPPSGQEPALGVGIWLETQAPKRCGLSIGGRFGGKDWGKRNGGEGHAETGITGVPQCLATTKGTGLPPCHCGTLPAQNTVVGGRIWL